MKIALVCPANYMVYAIKNKSGVILCFGEYLLPLSLVLCGFYI